MTDQQEPAQALTRRITGTETEPGITLALDDSHRLGPDEVARYISRPVVTKYGATDIFTPNAGRMYLDVGSHPEYATAECDPVSQLIAYDRSDEVILNELAEKAETELADESTDGKAYLLKNNVNIVGNPYGCHENYLVGRELGLKSLSKLLLPFSVTRQLTCSVGKIFLPYPTSPRHSDPIQYCFSQCADHVWEGVSSVTTHSRPIINARDELYAGSNRFYRLHAIVDDSNMSEMTTALRISSTQLALEMIGVDAKLPDLEIANEIKSIHAASHDMTGKAEIPLRSGETTTALQAQYEFLDATTEQLKVREENIVNKDKGTAGADMSNEEMSRIIELWSRALDAVEIGDWSLIERDIDWAIKCPPAKHYLDRGLALEDPRLYQIDLVYHDIHPGRGISHALEARGIASRRTTDEQVAEAVRITPPTACAKLCDDFLVAARDSSLKIVVGWTHLKISGDDPISTVPGDPFATENNEVNKMIETLTTAKKASDTDSNNQFRPRKLPQEKESHSHVYLAGIGRPRIRYDQ